MLFRKQRPVTQENGLRPYVAAWERHLHRVLQRHEVACRVVDKVRAPQVFTFRLRLADPNHLGKLLALEEQQHQAMPWLPLLPPGPAQASRGQAWGFDGTYRDTTVHQDIEIE